MGFFLRQESSQQPIFQPCQIVCLEHEASRLYAEVVQTVEARQICWVRPLALLVNAPLDLEQEIWENPTRHCHDLRSGSDLLYPLSLFRTALDTEVMPLLSYLYTLDHQTASESSQLSGHKQLRQFIQKIWQAYPSAFSSS